MMNSIVFVPISQVNLPHTWSVALRQHSFWRQLFLIISTLLSSTVFYRCLPSILSASISSLNLKDKNNNNITSAKINAGEKYEGLLFSNLSCFQMLISCKRNVSYLDKAIYFWSTWSVSTFAFRGHPFIPFASNRMAEQFLRSLIWSWYWESIFFPNLLGIVGMVARERIYCTESHWFESPFFPF